VDDQNIVKVYSKAVSNNLGKAGFLTCPCGDTPVSTVTLQVGSTRIVADSQPPAGVAAEGPIAQNLDVGRNPYAYQFSFARRRFVRHAISA